MQLSDRLQHLQTGYYACHQPACHICSYKVVMASVEKNLASMMTTFRLIREKFPSETLEYVGQAQAKDMVPWKVPQLLNALDQATRTFEVIEDSAPPEPPSSPSSLTLHFTSQSSPRGLRSSNTSTGSEWRTVCRRDRAGQWASARSVRVSWSSAVVLGSRFEIKLTAVGTRRYEENDIVGQRRQVMLRRLCGLMRLWLNGSVRSDSQTAASYDDTC
ncbi:hypothetical protein COOONC_05368 [Cooperia oncophora]